jgi:beta-lactamase regulating signal transducer with metallopeptidase domain/tetratricopeptide (TPR) repeat protein
MDTLMNLLHSLPAIAVALVKATIVLMILQLMVKALRVSAASKHLMLIVGITGFLLFPFFGVLLPTWDLPVLPEANAAAIYPQDDLDFSRAATAPYGASFGTSAGASSSERATPAVESVTIAAPSLQEGQGRSIQWMSISIYAWMTVALLLFSRVLLGLLRVWWIIRTAVPVSEATSAIAHDARTRLGIDRAVRLLASDYVDVPMICGLFRPTILLPASIQTWEAGQLEVVLLHEYAHLKRWDALTLLLTNLVTSLFWFHPQVWFASLGARRECERACDDLVLSSGTKPSDYAGHLLSIVKLMPEIERFGAVTLAMSQRSQLEGRLLAILHPRLRRATIPGKWVAISLFIVALMMAPLAALRLTASPQTTGGDGSFGVTTAALTPSIDPNPIHLIAGSKKMDRQAREDGGEAFDRAYKLHHAGQYDQAIAEFKKAAELGYKTDTAKYNIACGYAQKKQNDAALQYLEQAIQEGFNSFEHLRRDSDLDPLRKDPRFKALVAQYRTVGDHERKEAAKEKSASAKLELLRRTNSTNGELWYEVGSKLLSLRKLDDAVFALNEAVKHLGYRNQNAMYNLACAYAVRGDRQNALTWIEKAVNAGYDDPDHIRRDEDFESLQDDPRFENIIELAEDLSLHNHQSRIVANEPQYSKRRWASTVEHFDSYVRRNPNSGRAWFNLGFALHYSQQHQRATDSFQRAINLGYRIPTAMYNLACAHAMLGQKDLAFQWLERSERAGFELDNYLYNDEDLEILHDDPRFEAMAQRIGAEKNLVHEMKKFLVKKDKKKNV